MRYTHNDEAGPRVVTVSGSGGGCGKTLMVERLLRAMPDAAAVKVQATETGAPELMEETDPEANRRKDTGRYLAAGARRAYLLRGRADALLGMAQKLVNDAGTRVVIFETNALATKLAPDLSFFVEGEQDKPGADRCRRAADVIVKLTPPDGWRRAVQ
ncbi:MAG: hypothetical protein R6X33_10510 [Candidatus Brocadiia bacterium]